MTELPILTLQRLVTALDSIPAAYAIIGGVAVSIQSSPRFTEDVDAVLWFGEDNWEKVVDQLTKFGFKPRAEDPIAFAKKNRLLLLVDEGGIHVDLSFGALPFEEFAVQSAQRVEISEGQFASVASAEALLVMKAIAWRPKDILDIREIVAVNPSFDRDFVISTFKGYAELLEVPERVAELKSIFDGTG